jgi:ATP-binding cassette subfamily B protein/ATP-binding cassette subfamily C protein
MYLVFLVLLTVGLSLIEIVGISAIMPFISLASNPGLLDTGWYRKAFDFLGLAKKEHFIVLLGIIIIFFYFFRAVYGIIHSYIINRFSLDMYKYFARKLFETFLALPYRLYAQKNSGELTQIINNESRNVCNLVQNMLQFCSELFILLFIYGLMLLINWQMTLVVSLILPMIVLIFLRVLVRKNKAFGIKRSTVERKLFRTLRETFGNFKFVKLKGNEGNILRVFDSLSETYAKAEVNSRTLAVLPRGILECLGFSLLIAAVIYILLSYRDPAKVIPIISMYALALYRSLPSIHKMIGNINNIAYIQNALDIVHENISQPLEHEGSDSVAFEKNIRLDHVTFGYTEDHTVLRSVSLEIRKGEKIAFTGESGSGKSTLVDLIIGIHTPVSGTIAIDGVELSGANLRSWRSKIGYIPQSVYLFDGTVAENVAFGSEPDEERIRRALRKANIWDFLSRKEGIHTRVGEGGIQLSGGQQQRIAIARALYDDPDVLVLDEATSALDTETEAKIMDEIYNNVGSDKTLIVIAHRLSTVERCDRKIRVENGELFIK